MARRPRPLDEDEARAWRAVLDGTQLVRARIERELQRSGTVPPGYYGIPVALAEAPDRAVPVAATAVREHLLDVMDDDERATVAAVFGRVADRLRTELGMCARLVDKGDTDCCG